MKDLMREVETCTKQQQRLHFTSFGLSVLFFTLQSGRAARAIAIINSRHTFMFTTSPCIRGRRQTIKIGRPFALLPMPSRIGGQIVMSERAREISEVKGQRSR